MAVPRAVLGINSAHDAAACLLLDGRLEVAISEERLSRVKHHEGFPYQAVEYCLKAGGLGSLNDVECVVLNEYAYTDFTLELTTGGYRGQLITNPSHHLLHAYYAWIASGFDDAAIMIIDGSGYSYGEYVRQGSSMLGDPPPYSEMEEAESLYVVRGGRLELLGKRWALWEASEPYYRFASLGHMYSIVSQYIFGHWKHAGKTMGLAPYGDASSFPEPLVDLSGPEMVIHTEWAARLPPRSAAPAHLDPVCRDLAAKVQAELERAMLHLANRLHAETGQERLCISGGVGLNSVTNGRILRELPYSQLFVTPAAGDAGVSIGAAVYGHHQMTQTRSRWRYRDDYHGRSYHEAEITEALERRGKRLRSETVDSAVRAAGDIAAGLVIGWFEGGSEFGPRALGHRSILCDPRSANMRDRLNELVKFREPFRPYAASVLAEHVHDYFDMAVDDPFMLIVAPIVPHRKDSIAAVCHVDGTCRIQTVRAEHPGRFRRVLECFYELTGLPLVLNTSFNVRGEPIVETPGEAMDCFLGSNLDVLYIEGLRITKATLATAARPAALVPVLATALSLETSVSSVDGCALDPQHFAQTRTGHRAPVSADDLTLMRSVDGKRTVGDIGQALREQVSVDVETAFAGLQRRGFVSFRFEDADIGGG